MSFDQLGLSPKLLRAVAEEGYSEPTPIQRLAIPVILSGKDVLAAAQTGTGKTAGFTLPMLQRLSENPVNATVGVQAGFRPLRTLVLTPTRELAAQVCQSVQTYGRYLNLRMTTVFGGVNINPQIQQLRRGVDILVATPGRLLDHVRQRTVDLSRIEMLVLDEADRMLDMGFIHDIRKIIALLSDHRQRQTLLFSATFSPEIQTLAAGLLHNPESIQVAPQQTSAASVKQLIHPVDKNRKRELLRQLIVANDWRQVLVFTRTKHGSNKLAEQLERDGLQAAAINGNKSQNARTQALAAFKNGKVRVLVATDIAARGLDIDRLPYVVNYELPNVPQDYVHRIGRTGRAGLTGEAVSLVCVDEHKLLRDIERMLRQQIPSQVLDGFAPDPSIRPEPIENGRNRQRNFRPRERVEGRSQGRFTSQRSAAAGYGSETANGRSGGSPFRSRSR